MESKLVSAPLVSKPVRAASISPPEVSTRHRAHLVQARQVHDAAVLQSELTQASSGDVRPSPRNEAAMPSPPPMLQSIDLITQAAANPTASNRDQINELDLSFSQSLVPRNTASVPASLEFGQSTSPLRNAPSSLPVSSTPSQTTQATLGGSATLARSSRKRSTASSDDKILKSPHARTPARASPAGWNSSTVTVRSRREPLAGVAAPVPQSTRATQVLQRSKSRPLSRPAAEPQCIDSAAPPLPPQEEAVSATLMASGTPALSSRTRSASAVSPPSPGAGDGSRSAASSIRSRGAGTGSYQRRLPPAAPVAPSPPPPPVVPPPVPTSTEDLLVQTAAAAEAADAAEIAALRDERARLAALLPKVRAQVRITL